MLRCCYCWPRTFDCINGCCPAQKGEEPVPEEAEELQVETWRCGECGHEFELNTRPETCPSCKHHHCGDDQCCWGEMFTVIVTSEPIDYKRLLVLYIAEVIDHESVDYVDYLSWNKAIPTTEKEIKVLRELAKLARQELEKS